MTSLLRKILIAALPAVLMVPISAAAAGAGVVGCGTFIAQDTVLQNDVGPCTGTALHVAADNITLDLNGHRVFGARPTGEGAGIYLFNRTGVTVRNGSVSSFDMGVAIEGGSANTVERVNAVGNIAFEGTAGRTGGDGIAILSSRNNRILRNNTVNNGPYSGIGIYSEIDAAHPRVTAGPSTGNVLDGNVVANNIQARQLNNVVNNDNIGIRLEPGNSGNFILNNQVHGNGLDGITLFVRSTNNVIRGNTATRNGFYRRTARRGNGIGLQIGGANDNLVENNIASGNADNGISIRNGSLRNTVRNNTAVYNAMTPPVSQNFGPIFDLLDNNQNCDLNVWRDNIYRTAFPACAADTP